MARNRDAKNVSAVCSAIHGALRSVGLVALAAFIFAASVARGGEKVEVTVSIPVSNTIGYHVYLDLDPESSTALWTSLELARKGQDGWKEDDGYMYQAVTSSLIVDVSGRDQDSVIVSDRSLLVFKDKAWRQYSDPFVKKLYSAFEKSWQARLGPRYRAVEKAEALRAALKTEGIGATIRTAERKVGKAAAMISIRSEGGDEVIVELTQDTAEELYKEFRDANSQEDGWVARDKIVWSTNRAEVLLAYDQVIHSFSFAPEGLNMTGDRRYRTIANPIAKKLAACQAKVALNVSNDIDSETLAQRLSEVLNSEGMKAVVRKKK